MMVEFATEIKPNTTYIFHGECPGSSFYWRYFTVGKSYTTNNFASFTDDTGDSLAGSAGYCRWEEVKEPDVVEFATEIKPNTTYIFHGQYDTSITTYSSYFTVGKSYKTGPDKKFIDDYEDCLWALPRNCKWEEVKEMTGPVQTVTETITKKKIVPGLYDLGLHIEVKVTEVHTGSIKFGTTSPDYYFRAENLRNLAKMCNELADALEEGNN